MKFRSAALIVVVLLFGWAALDSPAQADELTDNRTVLREAIRAEDMEAVVAVIERARKAGDEELRSLYEVFDTTDPATAAFVSIAVPLVVFFTMQRFLVRGLLAGSVK